MYSVTRNNDASGSRYLNLSMFLIYKNANSIKGKLKLLSVHRCIQKLRYGKGPNASKKHTEPKHSTRHRVARDLFMASNWEPYSLTATQLFYIWSRNWYRLQSPSYNTKCDLSLNQYASETLTVQKLKSD